MPTRAEREHKIRLVLNGLASEGGHVRASDLQRELYLLLAFLQKAEEAPAEGSDTSVYYVVTALRHDSPATIELEARVYTFDAGKKKWRGLIELNGNVAGHPLVICMPPLAPYKQMVMDLTTPSATSGQAQGP